MQILEPYFWWILAAALLIGELLQPGFFLMWIAGAAALTGLVHFIYPMTWAAEALVFAVFSIAVVGLSWRWVSAKWQVTSDQPHLNQRQWAMVGRELPLMEAIVQGRGKVTFDDTVWDVMGADTPKGTMVRVTGVDGLRLKVTKA